MSILFILFWKIEKGEMALNSFHESSVILISNWDKYPTTENESYTKRSVTSMHIEPKVLNKILVDYQGALNFVKGFLRI